MLPVPVAPYSPRPKAGHTGPLRTPENDVTAKTRAGRIFVFVGEVGRANIPRQPAAWLDEQRTDMPRMTIGATCAGWGCPTTGWWLPQKPRKSHGHHQSRWMDGVQDTVENRDGGRPVPGIPTVRAIHI